MKKLIRIKDWYITPSWARGLAVGTIIGAILMIPSAFLIKNPITILIPVVVVLSCSIIGTLATRKKKEFGLTHKPN